MNCKKAQSWFGSFLDQGLDPKKAEALMAHLRSCSGCAAAWKRFRMNLGALKDLPRIEPSPGFEANLWRRIREEAPEPRWRTLWGTLTEGAVWPRMAGAAAAVSIVFGILLVGGILGPGDSPTRAPLAVDASRNRTSAPAGEDMGMPAIRQVASSATDSGRDMPDWARVRSGRLERGFSGFEGMVDTAGVEPEFVIRTVSDDPNAPPMRAF
jgi:anti-sigma-K factor RskA